MRTQRCESDTGRRSAVLSAGAVAAAGGLPAAATPSSPTFPAGLAAECVGTAVLSQVSSSAPACWDDPAPLASAGGAAGGGGWRRPPGCGREAETAPTAARLTRSGMSSAPACLRGIGRAMGVVTRACTVSEHTQGGRRDNIGGGVCVCAPMLCLHDLPAGRPCVGPACRNWR